MSLIERHCPKCEAQRTYELIETVDSNKVYKCSICGCRHTQISAEEKIIRYAPLVITVLCTAFGITQIPHGGNHKV